MAVRRLDRLLREPACALLLAAIALVLFLWPALAEPQPAIEVAWAHLLIGWVLVIALNAIRASKLRRRRCEEDQ